MKPLHGNAAAEVPSEVRRPRKRVAPRAAVSFFKRASAPCGKGCV